MRTQDTQRGFIALMSTVVISAILITLMASVALASFFARFDSLGLENKRSAQALAESCIEVALLALSTSTDPLHYAASDLPVIVGTDARGAPIICVIRDVIHSGSNITIDTYAQSDGSFENISASATLPPDIKIVSWGGQE